MTFGQPHIHHESCSSTNDLARAWACDPLDPAPHGALVTADYQTRGRGRRGRTWIAPSGQSILMSLVLHLESDNAAQAWPLAFAASLAVSDVLSGIVGDCKIKWPNDILIEGGKAAGILVEVFRLPASQRWAAIVGIGVNVNQEAFPESAGYLHPPVSLRMATGQNWDREGLVQTIAARISYWEEIRNASDSTDSLLTACRARLAVGCRLHRGGVTGELIDLLDDGRAQIRLADGTMVVWDSVDGEEGINGV